MAVRAVLGAAVKRARLRRSLAGLAFTIAGLLDDAYAVPDIPGLVEHAERMKARALAAERRLGVMGLAITHQRQRLEGLARVERFSQNATVRTVAWAAVREALDDIQRATGR